MKKVITLAVCGVLLLSSCGSTTSSGAWTGATFGSIIGSAIGGIMGGPRGSDVGTLVGMATGTAIGAASGAAAERERQAAYEEHAARRQAERQARQSRQYNQQDTYSYDDSGYTEQGKYDDRLYDFDSSNGSVGHSTVTTVKPSQAASLQIINARFVDENHDGYLVPNEQAKVVFEIKNTGKVPAFDVLPMVAETTGNKHLQISDNVHIESIQPGATIRYAAMVLCDNRIRNGEVCFSVGVRYNGSNISSPQYFRVPVRK